LISQCPTWWVSSSRNHKFQIAVTRAVIFKIPSLKITSIALCPLVLPRKLDFFNLLVTNLFTWAKWCMYVVFDLSLKHTTTRGIILICIFFISGVCVWQILIPDPSKMVQPDPRETMQSQFAFVVIPWGICKWDWICFTAAPSYNPNWFASRQSGFLKNVMFHLQYLFQLFEWHACEIAGLS